MRLRKGGKTTWTRKKTTPKQTQNLTEPNLPTILMIATTQQTITLTKKTRTASSKALYKNTPW